MDKKLGRGLAALLGGEEANDATYMTSISIKLLVPNENQPRKTFNEDKLTELAASIKSHGVLQPVVVRKVDGSEKYEIIAGERRWRAAQIAKLQEIPVSIVKCEDSDILAMSIIENIQRADLNPMEEAEAIQTLITDCACTQEELGTILGKSRSYIGNALRMLYLPDSVKRLVSVGLLSNGHAKCLIGVENAEEIAKAAVKRMMNVRQVENMVKLSRGGAEKQGQAGAGGTKIDKSVDQESIDIAGRVSDALQVEARLKITRKGGVFTLVCKSCEELEELVERLLSLGEV
jgi:ParB family chromosome partitioning protein